MTSEGTWRKKLADLTIKCVPVVMDSVELDVLKYFPMNFPGGLSNSAIARRATPICTSISENCITKVRCATSVPFSHNSASHQRADIISHIDTDGQFVQAEQHLVASCKRDAAVMLAEMAYEWQVLMTSGR